MNRATSAVATLAASALVLAGCASDEDEVRLAEPVLDFPYTSTTAAPTFEMPVETEAEDEETETETTASETAETSETTTTESSTRTSTRTSTKTSTSRRSSSSSRRAEPEPQPVNPEPSQPGATCAWPNQAEANGREFSTFCDREWARTMLDGQQYFWRAKGNGWVSVDPEGMLEDDVCWNRSEFDGAPEAIRNAAVYCAPVETPTTT